MRSLHVDSMGRGRFGESACACVHVVISILIHAVIQCAPVTGYRTQVTGVVYAQHSTPVLEYLRNSLFDTDSRYCSTLPVVADSTF